MIEIIINAFRHLLIALSTANCKENFLYCSKDDDKNQVLLNLLTPHIRLISLSEIEYFNFFYVKMKKIICRDYKGRENIFISISHSFFYVSHGSKYEKRWKSPKQYFNTTCVTPKKWQIYSVIEWWSEKCVNKSLCGNYGTKAAILSYRLNEGIWHWDRQLELCLCIVYKLDSASSIPPPFLNCIYAPCLNFIPQQKKTLSKFISCLPFKALPYAAFAIPVFMYAFYFAELKWILLNGVHTFSMPAGLPSS